MYLTVVLKHTWIVTGFINRHWLHLLTTTCRQREKITDMLVAETGKNFVEFPIKCIWLWMNPATKFPTNYQLSPCLKRLTTAFVFLLSLAKYAELGAYAMAVMASVLNSISLALEPVMDKNPLPQDTGQMWLGVTTGFLNFGELGWNIKLSYVTAFWDPLQPFCAECGLSSFNWGLFYNK